MTLILLGVLTFLGCMVKQLFSPALCGATAFSPSTESSLLSYTTYPAGRPGIGIIVGFLGASFWLLGQEQLNYPLFLTVMALALIIALTSLLDDLFHLPIYLRLSIHVLASLSLMLGLSNLAFYHPLDLFGLPVWAVMLGVVLISSGWINVFNFMDGIDGLAATQAIFMLVAVSILSLSQHPDLYQHAIWLWMPLSCCGNLGLFNVKLVAC